MESQRIEAWRRGDSAAAGDIKYAHTRRISKFSIFCDHGHEIVAPRTCWTFVDMRNVGIVNGSERLLSFRAMGETAFDTGIKITATANEREITPLRM